LNIQIIGFTCGDCDRKGTCARNGEGPPSHIKLVNHDRRRIPIRESDRGASRLTDRHRAKGDCIGRGDEGSRIRCVYLRISATRKGKKETAGQHDEQGSPPTVEPADLSTLMRMVLLQSRTDVAERYSVFCKFGIRWWVNQDSVHQVTLESA
jgi:hypothetical protein